MARSTRLEHAEYIATRLHHLSALLRTFSRNGLNDGSVMLEPICSGLFNALWGWELVSTNLFRSNYPAIDLIDTRKRIGVQITSSADPNKVTHTQAQIAKLALGRKLQRMIIFFLLPEAPGGNKKALHKSKKSLDVWSITELLGLMMHDRIRVESLAEAREVLDSEMGVVSGLNGSRAPEIRARFQTNPQGKVERDGKEYCIDLWVKQVPCATKRVQIKIMDDTFEPDEWQVKRKHGKAGDMEFLTDDMNSYGDVLIRAQGGLEGPTWRIETTLYQALVRTHGTKPEDRRIREALTAIRDN